MKQILLCALLLSAGFLCMGASDRIVRISGKHQKITRLEVVIEKKAPLYTYAAKELQTFLRQAADLNVKVVKAPSGKGVVSLVLGDCSFARKAKIDINKLPQEGYYIIRKGDLIFFAGRDRALWNPDMNHWEQAYPRATLSAVYDFLERFASVRFYFPGKYGTVVPAKGAFYLPQNIYIMERPDMCQRNYTNSYKHTHGYPGFYTWNKIRGKAHLESLTRSRLRMSEFMVPHCHGLNYLKYIQRFGKTNPEYFAMLPDGSRYNKPNMLHTGQLCFSGPLREVIYQDIKAALSGKSAKTRGLTHWHYNSAKRGFICIAPQDWMYWCGCPRCRKVATPGRSKIFSEPKDMQSVSDFIWKMTSEFGFRLIKENVKGFIAQSVYPPFNRIPQCKLPPNIRIMSCVFGRGGDKNDTELLRKWYEKNHRQKMDIWTYSVGKHMAKKIPGIIPMYPRNIGRFLDDNRKYIHGAYYESETDYWLYQYLNYYVLARKTWDNSVSVEKLLSEHHRVMFGKGAPFMKKFYDSLEDKWANRILGTVEDSPLGPRCVIPKDFEIWTKIYSPALIREYDALFDKALRAASADKGAVGRINFIRKNLLGPLKMHVERYNNNQKSLDSWYVTSPGTVFLRPFRGAVAEVSTKVSVRHDSKTLFVTFDCEEPRMNDILARETKRDSTKIHTDSCVELFLNPSGDRKHYYQFGVNANGALVDSAWTVGKKRGNFAWNSKASAKVVRKNGSWSVTLSIPLDSFGKNVKDSFPVNFCRSRFLNGKRPAVEDYFWNPISGARGGFHAVENWGTLYWKKAPPKVFYRQDFTAKRLPHCWRSEGAKGGQLYNHDKKIFISGGQSLYYKNLEGKMMGMALPLKGLKPKTKYRLSYFIRTKDLRWGKPGGGAYIGAFVDGRNRGSFPRSLVLGTTPWHRVSGVFTTPDKITGAKKSFLSIAIFRTGGEAWFDDIIVEEIK